MGTLAFWGSRFLIWSPVKAGLPAAPPPRPDASKLGSASDGCQAHQGEQLQGAQYATGRSPAMSQRVSAHPLRAVLLL